MIVFLLPFSRSENLRKGRFLPIKPQSRHFCLALIPANKDIPLTVGHYVYQKEIFAYWNFFLIWSASQICVSSLHRGHTNLLCTGIFHFYINSVHTLLDIAQIPCRLKQNLVDGSNIFFWGWSIWDQNVVFAVTAYLPNPW